MRNLAALAIEEQLVAIPTGSQSLYGKLTVPLESSGLILFAQGSSSRLHNPRSRYVDRYVERLLNESNLATILVPPPPFADPDGTLTPAVRRLVGKFDPVERDARNRDLGKAGERFVVAFERDRLRRAGQEDLADGVRWVSDLDGNGYGYDVGPSSRMARSGCWRSRRPAVMSAPPFGLLGGRSTSPPKEPKSIGSGGSSTFAAELRCSRSLRRWSRGS